MVRLKRERRRWELHRWEDAVETEVFIDRNRVETSGWWVAYFVY